MQNVSLDDIVRWSEDKVTELMMKIIDEEIESGIVATKAVANNPGTLAHRAGGICALSLFKTQIKNRLLLMIGEDEQ